MARSRSFGAAWALALGAFASVATAQTVRDPLLSIHIAGHPPRDDSEATRHRALETTLRCLAPTIRAALHTDPELPAALRLRYELSAGGAVFATGTEDDDGLARCRILPEAPCPPILRGLLQRFGYEATTGWLSIDVPAVTGNLASLPHDGGPLDETLMLAALDCGELALFARENDAGGWNLTARSEAGLLLPTLLMLLAEQSDTVATDDPLPLGDDLDRWLLIARASRHAEREEALRQLGRFDDPRAIEALEHTLFDPDLRDVAALALAHLGSPEALAALGRHAAHLDPDLAADGIWAALPSTVRSRIIARVEEETPPPGPQPTPVPTRDLLRDLQFAAGGTALGLLVAWLLVRRRADVA